MRGYDAAGNLTSVSDWLGHTTTFAYDADSNLEDEQYPGAVNTQLSYDNADRLIDMSDTSGAHPIASFSYVRDAIGQVGSETSDNGEPNTINYTYDALNRLTGENATPYGYDPADDPTTFGAGTTQSFDAASELTSRTEPGEVSEVPGASTSEEQEGSTPPGSSSGSENPPTPGAGPGSPPDDNHREPRWRRRGFPRELRAAVEERRGQRHVQGWRQARQPQAARARIA